MSAHKKVPSRISRVTVQLKLDPKAAPRKVWGIVTMRPDVAIIQVFNREGEFTNELIASSPESVLKVQPCVMNCFYGWLEIVR